MITATLTSKGQLTLPKAIRDSLHLRTGDRIRFQLTDNGEAVLKPITKSVDDVFGRLHDPAQASVSVDEMNAAIAARFKNRAQ